MVEGGERELRYSSVVECLLSIHLAMGSMLSTEVEVGLSLE